MAVAVRVKLQKRQNKKWLSLPLLKAFRQSFFLKKKKGAQEAGHVMDVRSHQAAALEIN